jgi:hypothetical protein
MARAPRKASFGVPQILATGGKGRVGRRQHCSQLTLRQQRALNAENESLDVRPTIHSPARLPVRASARCSKLHTPETSADNHQSWASISDETVLT